MSEHTKEPWSHFNSGRTNAIYDGGRREIVAWMGFDRSDRSKSEHRANARRIVACVNACAGIPTARLECGAADVLAYSMELKQQRDELLAALKATRGQWIHSVNANQCLAAIANAEGQ